MAAKKMIAAVGATGAQGGGLVRAILSDISGGFTTRALTRNVDSAKATELAKLGAEVVAADVDDMESLKRAFAGAYGAFCVTFFWDHRSPEKELRRPRRWPMRPSTPACSTSSGPRSKTRASGCH